MIKPTVGRVVWYYPALDDSKRNGTEPLAAIVTNVWSDTCVNLSIFDANGLNFNETSVLLDALSTGASREDGGRRKETRESGEGSGRVRHIAPRSPRRRVAPWQR